MCLPPCLALVKSFWETIRFWELIPNSTKNVGNFTGNIRKRSFLGASKPAFPASTKHPARHPLAPGRSIRGNGRPVSGDSGGSEEDKYPMAHRHNGVNSSFIDMCVLCHNNP